MERDRVGRYSGTNEGVRHQFAPFDTTDDAGARIATALEYIAIMLGRIDHNIEGLAKKFSR